MFCNRPNLEDGTFSLYEEMHDTCATYEAHTVQREVLKKITAASEVSLKIQVAASPEILLN